MTVDRKNLLEGEFFEQITPKAFANFSPGFEHLREPWGINLKIATNPERVRQLANPFRV